MLINQCSSIEVVIITMMTKRRQRRRVAQINPKTTVKRPRKVLTKSNNQPKR